jgi:ribosome-binding factor A
MSEFKKEHLTEELRKEVSNYLARESNGTSLLTVTRVDISDNMKFCTLFISVLPENKETEAIHFVKRSMKELQEYLREHVRVARLPFLSVELDKGEKLRQRMDEVL